MKKILTVFAIVVGGCMGLAASAQAATVVVDYGPEVFSQLSFSKGGVTVTGTADVFSIVGRGIGIDGIDSPVPVFNDFTTDRADGLAVMETITFSFDGGAATGINLFVGSGVLGGPAIDIEAFASGGASLGLASVTGFGPFLVDSLFSNTPIESFRLSNTFNDRGFSISIIEYNAVPIPAAAWLFGSALGLLGWMRRKTV